MITEKETFKKFGDMARKASVQQTAYTLAAIAAAFILAAFGAWCWAWLVLAAGALKLLGDGIIGVTTAIGGVLLQIGSIDERLKKSGP